MCRLRATVALGVASTIVARTRTCGRALSRVLPLGYGTWTLGTSLCSGAQAPRRAAFRCGAWGIDNYQAVVVF